MFEIKKKKKCFIIISLNKFFLNKTQVDMLVIIKLSGGFEVTIRTVNASVGILLVLFKS